MLKLYLTDIFSFLFLKNEKLNDLKDQQLRLTASGVFLVFPPR